MDKINECAKIFIITLLLETNRKCKPDFDKAPMSLFCLQWTHKFFELKRTDTTLVLVPVTERYMKNYFMNMLNSNSFPYSCRDIKASFHLIEI